MSLFSKNPTGRQRAFATSVLTLLLALLGLAPAGADSIHADQGYRISTGMASSMLNGTGQGACYDDQSAMACPAGGQPFYGQDAQFGSQAFDFIDNGDGTIRDNVTGLLWQQSPDTDNNGTLDISDKLTFEQAAAYCEGLELAGLTDWQLPGIKALYSLIDFSGVDPSGYDGNDTSGLVPFIDTDYFDFAYGDTAGGERIIDAQFASSTEYVSTTGPNGSSTLFGVNFADGRIKGYGLRVGPNEKVFNVLCVHGADGYGDNELIDNGNGTISDRSTALMWAQEDSGPDAPGGLDWLGALNWVQSKNAAGYLGYSDWRLPNAKELQSLLDYSRSPDTTGTAAIDPLFSVTGIVNEAGQDDFPAYWSGTTHVTMAANNDGASAVYVNFGRSMGYMDERWVDVHGAGAQRSDPKAGDPDEYPYGRGPQGDAIRIYNHARLVRGTVDHSITGAWYDPAHNGEGFLVELLDEQSAVVYWFTYDGEGDQRWFIGNGVIEGDQIVFDELLAGSGARFGEEFNPADVVLSPVGQLTLQWSDCNTASASYVVEGQEGSQSLVRLTGLAGRDCGTSQPGVNPQTGSWYDRTHSGEGVILEVLPDDGVLVFWFSYNDEGRPAWFYGLGQLDDYAVRVDELVHTHGGRFGAEFNPEDVVTEPWGSILIDLDCNYGKLDYTSGLDAFGSGKQTLLRLTNPGNVPCDRPEPPNILLVIADDLGKDAFAQYPEGDDPPDTPILDTLAQQGLVFENAWSNPTCTPTRAGILTGKYGFRTGVLDPTDALDPSEPSLHEFIEQYLPSRYRSAVIGKWHLTQGRRAVDHPASFGISHFAGILGGGVEDYENWVLTANGEQTDETTYSTTKLTDLAIDWIAADAQPWFLWLAFNAPHTPFHLPPQELHERQLENSQEAIEANPRPYYLAAIEAMDHEIGRLLDSLDDQTRENTLVVFLGDNGTPGQVAINPYARRKAKGSLYQGGVNVPFFVSGAGVVRSGGRETALVNTTDLFASLAAVTGVNVEAVNDSVSFAGLMESPGPSRRDYLYTERDDEGLWDRAVFDGQFKLVDFDDGRQEMYDLLADPYEDNELLDAGTAPAGQQSFLLELLGLITGAD